MNRFISLLLLLVITSTATAQQWEQTNGVGGDGTQSIAVNPQGHIFVAARALHRSTDGGITWTRLFPEAISGSINKIVVQPSGRVIVSTRVNTSFLSIYGSDDNGNSWKKLRDSIQSFYAGASGSLFAIIGYYRILGSNDNGDTWNELTLNGVNGAIYCASKDGSGTLYVCAQYLYRSTDNGVSWGKIINGISLRDGTVAISPDGMPYIYDNSGFYKSVDNGRTWNTINLNNYGVTSLAFNKKDIFVSLASNSGTISYSSDNGATWIKPPIGNNPGYGGVCAAEPDGKFLFTLEDHLRRFDPIDIANASLVSIPNGNISALISGPDGSIITFSSAKNIYTSYANYAWRSNDRGDSWLILNTNYIFPSGSGTTPVRVTALDSSGMLFATENNYILQSSDAGFSWESLSPRLITDGVITSLAIDHNHNLFACSSTEGVFRTSDNGKTWDQLNSGIQDQRLFSICTDINGDIYTAGYTTVYRSTNSAVTWSKLAIDLPMDNSQINSISISKQGTIYISSTFHSVNKSTDKGQTWTSDSSLIPATVTNKVLSTPDGKTFAATDSGVFYNDGNPNSTWHRYNDGLTAKNVQTLCIDPQGFLYAGTDVSGIFRSKERFGTTTRGVKSNSANSIFSLNIPYPNPISTSTTIPFSISERASVHLDVADALGRVVAVLADEIYDIGSHTVSFDAKDLPVGVYYVRLRSGSNSQIRTVVKAQ